MAESVETTDSSHTTRRSIADLSDAGPLARLMLALETHPRVSLGLFALILAVQVGPWLYATADASRYLSVARSMAGSSEVTGFGSRSLGVLPGYPLLLAPAFALSERPFLYIAIEHWVLALIAVIGIYRWARRVCPEAAVLIAALSLLNATFLYYFRRPLKEVADLAVLIWLVNVLHWLLEKRSMPATIGGTFVAGLLLTLAALIRYSGMMLAFVFAAAMIYEAWQRRISWTRAIAVTAAIALPTGGAVLWYMDTEQALAREHAGGSYLNVLMTAFRNPALPTTQPVPAGEITVAAVTPRNRYLAGVELKVSEIWRTVLPGMFKEGWQPHRSFWLVSALHLACAVAVGLGWKRLLHGRIDLLAMMFPCYLLLYIPLACDQGTRLMTPFLPLLMACLWFLLRGWPYRTAAMTLLAIIHLSVGMGYWLAFDGPRAYQTHLKWPAMEQIARAIPVDQQLVAMDKRDAGRFELEFLLDRMVFPIPDVRQWPDASGLSQWIVLTKNMLSAQDPGIQARAANYVLLLRPIQLISATPVIALRPDTSGRR